MSFDQIQSDLIVEFKCQNRVCEVLTRQETSSLEEVIITKFCSAKRPSRQLWESIQSTEAFYLPNECDETMSREVQKLRGPLYVLIADWSAYSGLKVLSGNDWFNVISKMYFFVWYAYDSSSDSLVCFNDHDFLIVSKFPPVQNDMIGQSR